MKLAVMTYAMSVGGWDFSIDGVKKLCEFTREQEIEGIDWVTTYGNDPKEIRKIMDDYGLKTVCYTNGADLNFTDRESRIPGLESVKQNLEYANILGTDKIMLPIGQKKGHTTKESLENNILGLREAVELAKGTGITITLEHMHGLHSPFVTSSDMEYTLANVPGLKLTFDSGNCVTGGEPAVEAFRKSRESIVHAHFKDWVVSSDNTGIDGSDGKYYTPVLVGEGIVEYEPLVKEMIQSGYDGFIDIEYQAEVYAPKDAVIMAKKYIYDLIDKVRAEL